MHGATIKKTYRLDYSHVLRLISMFYTLNLAFALLNASPDFT